MSKLTTPEASTSRMAPPTPQSTGSESAPGVPGVPFHAPGRPVNIAFTQQQPTSQAAPGYAQYGLPEQHRLSEPSTQQMPTEYWNNLSSMQQQRPINCHPVLQPQASAYGARMGHSANLIPRPLQNPHQQQYQDVQHQPMRPQFLAYGNVAFQHQVPYYSTLPETQQSKNHHVPYPHLNRPQNTHNAPQQTQQDYNLPQAHQQQQIPQCFNMSYAQQQHSQTQHIANLPLAHQQQPQQTQPIYNPHQAPQPSLSSPPHWAQTGYNQRYVSQQSLWSPPDHYLPTSQRPQQQQMERIQPVPPTQGAPAQFSLPQNIQPVPEFGPSPALVERAFKGGSSITMEDFKRFLSEACNLQLPDDNFASLLHDASIHGNVSITREVFCTMLPRVVAVAAFFCANPNRKDDLILPQFRHAMEFLGINLGTDEIYRYFQNADSDRDLTVGMQEFIDILPSVARDKSADLDYMVRRFRDTAKPFVSQSFSVNVAPGIASSDVDKADMENPHEQCVSESRLCSATPIMLSNAFKECCEESLNFKGFKKVLEKLSNDEYEDDYAMKLFKRADKNGDGNISKKEIASILNELKAKQASPS